MRLFSCLVAISLPAMLASGCLTVSPDECWVNTSGGLGGEEPIPIGAGVGATTGGDYDEPPRGPLDKGGEPYNPCTAPKTPEKPPPQTTCEVPNPVAEGANSWICGEECSAKCAPHVRITYVIFSPSEFPFVTINKDDGKDNAGGWQEAQANLEFINAIVPRSVTKWYCDFTIGMPLRPEMMGKISAKRAADLSVEITEEVARGMNYDLPSVTFCADFIIAAQAAFKSNYPNLGARVK